MTQDCIFCKIANKEINTDFVLETENMVVFKDINPKAPVHLLIVPKEHIRSINDIKNENKDLIAEMIFTAKQAANIMSINESGYKLLFNVEKGGGQEVFHIHLHLMGGW
ncbi:MAG: histidine triad nucleotide-binding protein [Desulforegulaceae bacterium]|nr:histidine triad nucleotide-binding protein [Desulforegulaceae bacterium]